MALNLAAGRLSASVDPERGARLTSLLFDGTELLANTGNPLTSGCYPMAPWCGRIRGARFPWQGRTHAVPATDGAHALHGLVHSTAWEVIDLGTTVVTLRTSLGDGTWLANGSVTHTIAITDGTVRCELTVESDDGSFPAQVGWHPCFADAIGHEASFSTMYRREADGITDGRLTEPSTGPWDDCFTGLVSNPVVRWATCEAEITSDCSHWVVYDEVHGLVCIEPQSGPQNAFNHAPDTGGVGGFDAVVPGRPLTRWMEIRLAEVT